MFPFVINSSIKEAAGLQINNKISVQDAPPKQVQWKQLWNNSDAKALMTWSAGAYGSPFSVASSIHLSLLIYTMLMTCQRALKQLNKQKHKRHSHLYTVAAKLICRFIWERQRQTPPCKQYRIEAKEATIHYWKSKPESSSEPVPCWNSADAALVSELLVLLWLWLQCEWDEARK